MTPSENFSVAAMIRATLAQTWQKVPSQESRVAARLAERYGPTLRASNSARLPHDALALRDLAAAGVSGSNYLIATEQAGYLPSLQPASAVLALGAQTLQVDAGNIVIPTASAAATQWLADENSAITESQPTIGQVASSPKILAALVEVSHQLLTQSNAEDVVRAELRRAAASAIDRAALQGTGNAGQPLGIVNAAGIGAFTGTSLNRAELTNAQLDVATANAANVAPGYVTTPAAANALAGRADTIESARAVWQGPLHDGTLVGTRALSTTNCPAATAIFGDWSNVTVVSWGAPDLAVDPFTKFNTGLVALRLLLLVDIVVTRAAAFSVASSVT